MYSTANPKLRLRTFLHSFYDALQRSNSMTAQLAKCVFFLNCITLFLSMNRPLYILFVPVCGTTGFFIEKSWLNIKQIY